MALILDGNPDIGKKKSLLFDLFKAFGQIESNDKSNVFYPKSSFFLHASSTCSEVPSNISTMDLADENVHFSSNQPMHATFKKKLRACMKKNVETIFKFSYLHL